MTQEELKISVNVVAETAEEAVQSLQKEIKNLGGEVDDLGQKTRNAAAEQAAFAAAAAAAFGTLLSAVSKGTAALNSYQAAMKGLESVASGRGIADEELSKALASVTDGFFSATAAASAYKNLLTRGYTLEQATNAIMRLKDAAAFGRAASLSLEDAVVSATEGIKNENSVLVDNAGVTKNVAKMWEDYAKARGLVTANLTQAQKVEAEYLGIMQETQLQVGDLAKAAQTLAGSQAEQAAQITKLSTAYGSALEPAVKAVTETFTGFVKGATEIIEAAPEMAAQLTVTAVAFTGLMAVIKAAKTVQEAFNLAALANPYTFGAGVIAITIGTIAGAYTQLANAEKAAAEEAEKRAKQSEERQTQIDSLTREARELETIKKRYDELAGKQSLTKSETSELAGLVETLNTQYRISITMQGDLASAYAVGNAAISTRISGINAETRALAQLEQAYAQKNLNEINQRIDQLKDLNIDDVIAMPESVDIGDEFITKILIDIADRIEDFESAAPELANRMRDAAIVVEEGIQDGTISGADAINAALAMMYDQWSAFAQAYVDQLSTSAEDTQAYIDALDELIAGNLEGWNAYIEGVKTVSTDASGEITGASEEATQELDQIGTILKNINTTLNQTSKKLEWKRELLENRKAAKQAVDALIDGQEVSDKWREAIERLKTQMGAMNDIDLQNKLGAEIRALESETGLLEDQLDNTINAAMVLLSQIQAGAYGEITLDNQAALDAILEVIALLADTGLTVNDISGTTSKKGGGGGGKSKKEQAAEEARRAQEDLYRQQLEMIEHKRRMDQITAEEELDLLIMVRKTYAQTADQIREMDEKIYAARKALREAEQDQLTELHDAVMDALEERYEAQRKAEQERIDQSIAAWETWADETTDAIRKQIEALDDKAEAEDREAKSAEKLRAIDKIKQQMQYETDEYNLRQLKKQLDKAEADWAKTQADWAREDQKKALQEQIDLIEEQSQTQIDALKKESEAIDAYYDEMTQKARLELEAQEIMMRESQESIIALLKEYAPDYEATGKTFGEKFFDGFVSVMGDISSWFDAFAAAMESPIVKATQYATTSARNQGTGAAGTGAMITQNVTFTVPVESPGDTARRMQQVNEALAAMV